MACMHCAVFEKQRKFRFAFEPHMNQIAPANQAIVFSSSKPFNYSDNQSQILTQSVCYNLFLFAMYRISWARTFPSLPHCRKRVRKRGHSIFPTSKLCSGNGSCERHLIEETGLGSFKCILCSITSNILSNIRQLRLSDSIIPTVTLRMQTICPYTPPELKCRELFF